MMTPAPDREEILRALRLMLDPGQCVEVRIPKAGAPKRTHVAAGWFNDPAKLADAVCTLADPAEGVYATLNPVAPALLARANNRIVPRPMNTTSDADTLRRRRLLIDLDPVRPAGVSATDAEHELALERAREICRWLREQGWPLPLLADSGNGGHLVFGLDLPAKDDGLIDRVLQALALRFSDERVSVDTVVGNASRISKLYGTWARKGENTAERPHRLACILEAPDELVEVPLSALQHLASAAPKADTTTTPGRGFDLGAWLEEHADWFAEHAVEVRGPLSWGENQKWRLSRCPWNPEHTTGSAWLARFKSGGVAAGCHHNSCQANGWPELRDLVEGPGWRDQAEARPRAPSAAAQIVKLVAEEGAEIFLTPDGMAAATFPVNGHLETDYAAGPRFRNWIRWRSAEQRMTPVTGSALDCAREQLEAAAEFTGEEHEVCVRSGEADGKLYVDLGDRTHRAVEVDASGWRLVAKPPVRFLRPAGMLPLPEPRRGGELVALREVLNFGTETNYAVAAAWLAMALRPSGAKPILQIEGESGSTKTSMVTAVRRVVDPSAKGASAAPKNLEDLVVAARGGAVLAFDNLVKIPGWLSDALCMMSTGASHATRRFYTNYGEVFSAFRRPVIFCGVGAGDLAERGDMLQRTLTLVLPRIKHYQTEEEVEDRFLRVWPDVVGGVLTAMSTAMRNYAATLPPTPMRMASFHRWSYSACPALGVGRAVLADSFARCHEVARAAALDNVVVPLLRSVVEDHDGCFHGSATALLGKIAEKAKPEVLRSKGWPTTPTALSIQLTQMAPALREAGLEVERGTEANRRRDRYVELRDTSNDPDEQAAPDAGEGF